MEQQLLNHVVDFRCPLLAFSLIGIHPPLLEFSQQYCFSRIFTYPAISSQLWISLCQACYAFQHDGYYPYEGLGSIKNRGRGCVGNVGYQGREMLEFKRRPYAENLHHSFQVQKSNVSSQFDAVPILIGILVILSTTINFTISLKLSL